MKLKVSGLELLAISVTVALICLPLLAGSVDSASLVATTGAIKNSAGQSVNHQGNGNDYLVVLGVVIAFGNLCVIAFQSWIFGRQTELMDGQLTATQRAADAAVDALARPWLNIEVFGDNERDWAEGKEALFIKFRVVNYGGAPALIKSFRIIAFRGEDQFFKTGRAKLPNDVLDFPEPGTFTHFVYQRGRAPYLLVEEADGKVVLPAQVLDSVLLASGQKTDDLCLVAYGKVEPIEGSILPIFYTESYFLGWLYYEFPGNRAEFLQFCYMKDKGRSFRLCRDYAPYNETKNAKNHKS